MNRRLVHWLLALYPCAWRDRYGAEVASLTGELISAGETTPVQAGLNLIAGAAIERARALARSWGVVLALAAAAATATAGIALAVTHAQHSGEAMKPYFDENHPVGVLLLVVVLGWFLMEFIEFLQVQEWRERREGATRTGIASWWLAAGAYVIAANIWLYLAPPIVPAAAIRPGAAAFAVGMVIFLAGIALRGWSFKALGRYFTFGIVVTLTSRWLPPTRTACCATPPMREAC